MDQCVAQALAVYKQIPVKAWKEAGEQGEGVQEDKYSQ
jgi:hypothetical protein